MVGGQAGVLVLGVAAQHAQQQQGHGRAHGAGASVEQSMHMNTDPEFGASQPRLIGQGELYSARPHLGSGAATAWACSQLR